MSETTERERAAQSGNCICEAGYASTCPLHGDPGAIHSRWPLDVARKLRIKIHGIEHPEQADNAKWLDSVIVGDAELIEKAAASETASLREQLANAQEANKLQHKTIKALNEEVATFRKDCIAAARRVLAGKEQP